MTFTTPYLSPNRELVAEFIRATGLDKTHNAIGNQFNALLEEFSELEAAADMADEELILDGIGDCLFIIESLVILDPIIDVKAELEKVDEIREQFGISDEVTQEVVRRVCESNLSKFSDHPAQALETEKHYKSLGTHTERHYVGKRLVTKAKEDHTDINGKFIFKGKVLKCKVNFTEPDFSDLLPLNP